MAQVAEQSWIATLLSSPITAALSVVGGAFGAVAGAWRWGAERGDRRSEAAAIRDQAAAAASALREQKRIDALDALQAGLRAEQAALLADVRVENKDLKGEILELRADRDMGWNLARWWRNAAHDVLGSYRGLYHTAANLEQWMRAVVARTEGVSAPNIEALPETMPILPIRVDDALQVDKPK